MMDVLKLVNRDILSSDKQGVIGLFSQEARSSESGEWMLKSGTIPRAKSDEKVDDCVELDMGMGSRVEGFRICGHR